MKFDEFLQELYNDVERFRKEYQRGMREEPEWYPDEMEEGDWVDQFLTFYTGGI